MRKDEAVKQKGIKEENRGDIYPSNGEEKKSQRKHRLMDALRYVHQKR